MPPQATTTKSLLPWFTETKKRLTHTAATAATLCPGAISALPNLCQLQVVFHHVHKRQVTKSSAKKLHVYSALPILDLQVSSETPPSILRSEGEEPSS